MKQKNQIVAISGILVLLATATIAAGYNVQTAKAAANPAPFGKDTVSGFAKTGTLCVAGAPGSKSCQDREGLGFNPGGGNSFGQAVAQLANPNRR